MHRKRVSLFKLLLAVLFLVLLFLPNIIMKKWGKINITGVPNDFMGLITCIIGSAVGIYILLNRNKVIDALTASNYVFWNKMGFPAREQVTLMTRIMILLFGITFSIVGIFGIYQSIHRLTSQTEMEAIPQFNIHPPSD